ncbi:hypothetical protein OHA98_16065 [Streptomyces sp. NBC_00654]|uniref:hypothetical protein n=1 Tax=Streptomyces sp. NBC_00654 TaxID=2975799 RepID=UPI00225AA0D5|nr:hypothetical protein [Streptomyces sp. NBC_00654]MCX4966326.1 hypothetical protein [Streptomyces sp. NBC_00654]
MGAVSMGVTAEQRRRLITSEDVAMRGLAHALSLSLTAEGISDELIATVEEVLRDRPSTVADGGGQWLDGVLVRFGLPLPRRRPPAVEPLSAEDTARITHRFRRATHQLLQVAPYRVAVFPTEELCHLLALRDERPAPDEALSYLRRYALAIVTLLNLMGDDN